MQVNPDPHKFDMQIAHGVKAEARADAPDIAVPFCKAHGRWPCITCGTKHFDACECPYCVERVTKPPANVRKRAAPRCLRCGAGPEWIEGDL